MKINYNHTWLFTRSYLSHLAGETFRVAAVTCALYRINSKLSHRSVFFIAGMGPTYIGCWAPLLEEVTFRGLLMHDIHLIQKTRSINKFQTIEDLTREKNRRVAISAIFFGLAHFSNGLSYGTGFQVLYTTFLGFSWGEIAERTQSIADTVLLHGINNTLVVAVHVGALSMPHFSISFLALNIFTLYCAKMGGIEQSLLSLRKLSKILL